MTYKKGFITGIVAGFLLIGVSTGFVRATEEARDFAQSIGTMGLMLVLFVAILRPFKQGSVFNPTMDGFLSGFGASTKLYASILYGFTFP